MYAAPILFERNAYDVPVFTRVHDFMWSGEAIFPCYVLMHSTCFHDIPLACLACTLAYLFSESESAVLCVCAAMAMQNLGSPMQLGFPISNYTMSLSLLERIDFWDTTEDAIGEDFHMFVKAYFKTHGQVRHLPACLLQPIH